MLSRTIVVYLYVLTIFVSLLITIGVSLLQSFFIIIILYLSHLASLGSNLSYLASLDTFFLALASLVLRNLFLLALRAKPFLNHNLLLIAKITKMASTKIVSCRKVANGNYLINGNVWVNGPEMRGLLIGAGLSAHTPAVVLVGSNLVHETKVITDAMIIAKQNSVKSNRPYTNKDGVVVDTITYTTPGTKNFNFQLELADKVVGKLIEASVAEAIVETKERDAARRLLATGNQASPEKKPEDNAANQAPPSDEELLAQMEAEEAAAAAAQAALEDGK